MDQAGEIKVYVFSALSKVPLVTCIKPYLRILPQITFATAQTRRKQFRGGALNASTRDRPAQLVLDRAPDPLFQLSG